MSIELPPQGGLPIGSPEPGLVEASPAAPPLLAGLPTPGHLLEILTRSQHQHFGYFESPGDTLRQAQDRLITRSLRVLPRGSLVVDVGCGLGGTVRLLTVQGLRAYGIDPCPAAIGYARSQARPGAQFVVADLETFAARTRGPRFDAVVLTEVLASFPNLETVFGHCRSLLRPGGLVLVHDLVRLQPGPRKSADLPAYGDVRAAMDALGFDLVEGRDVSARVSPSLSRMQRLLVERRDEILRAFRTSRPGIAGEIEGYREHLRSLELAFLREEVAYQVAVLRCSTRLGSDSVVLRSARQVVPVGKAQPQ